MAGRQHRKTERVSYSGRKFVVSLEVCKTAGSSTETKEGQTSSSDGDAKRVWPRAMHEMMDSSGDFPPRTHHLSRWWVWSYIIHFLPSIPSVLVLL